MALKVTDDYYYDIIRVNIKKYRLNKGYTQEKLANECNLSVDYISEIESMKRKKSFSIAALGRIAEALDVEITKFFEKE